MLAYKSAIMDYKPGSVTLSIPTTTISAPNSTYNSPQQPHNPISYGSIPVVPYGNSAITPTSSLDRALPVQIETADGVYDILPSKHQQNQS